jgi:hypothetical protein
MKKKFVKLLFLSAFLLSVSFSATAQIYVKIRPVVPVIVRTPQPSRNHVWINEEWEPNGNEYRYTGGHWGTPPHRGYTYRQGHWRQHNNDGERWVRGNWRRR